MRGGRAHPGASRAAARRRAGRHRTEPSGAAACFNRLVRASAAPHLVLLESAVAGRARLAGSPAGGARRRSQNGPRAVHQPLLNEQGAFPSGRGLLPVAVVAAAAQVAARRFRPDARAGTAPQPGRLLLRGAAGRSSTASALPDEDYGPGPRWEMDYNVRAARAGFRGVWACAAYVHRLPFTPRRRLEESRASVRGRRAASTRTVLRPAVARRRPEPTSAHCRGDAASTSRARPDRRIREPQSWVAVAVAEAPLVTCIMPHARPAHLRAPRRPLLPARTIPARELLVVDDGRDPVSDCCLPTRASATCGWRRGCPSEPSATWRAASRRARTSCTGRRRLVSALTPATAGSRKRPAKLTPAAAAASTTTRVAGPRLDVHLPARRAPGVGLGQHARLSAHLLGAAPLADVQIAARTRASCGAVRPRVRDLDDPALCVAMIHGAKRQPQADRRLLVARRAAVDRASTR